MSLSFYASLVVIRSGLTAAELVAELHAPPSQQAPAEPHTHTRRAASASTRNARTAVISATGDMTEVDSQLVTTDPTIRVEQEQSLHTQIAESFGSYVQTSSSESLDQSIGNDCRLEREWSKDCKCKSDATASCKNCKDQFGFCWPAKNPSLNNWFRYQWNRKKPDKDKVTCPTSPVTNSVTGNQECPQNFQADFKFGSTPDSEQKCVCYEPAVNAPKKNDKDYLKFVLDKSKDAEQGYMYDDSVIQAESCAQAGYHYDKKVHPCYNHVYTVFRDIPCQKAFREYRQKSYEEKTWPGKLFVGPWNSIVGDDSPFAIDITKIMFAGGCNLGN